MAARYLIIDHDTPMLLPPSLRDWLAADHLVHVIMDAVEELDLSRARVNQRGSGDAQYPPTPIPITTRSASFGGATVSCSRTVWRR
jgi:hypothetical protein